MAVIIEGNPRVTSPITGTDVANQTSFLADNESDIITVEIDYRVETYRIAQTTDPAEEEVKNRIVIGPGPLNNGRLGDLVAIWISDTDTAWEDFNVGDQITIVGAVASGGVNNGTANIIEILEDDTGTQTLRTDRTFIGEILPINTGYVAVTTTVTALTFKHGLIENLEPINYLSKVDGSEQVAQIENLLSTNSSFQTAELLGNKSWQFGKIEVKGNGIGQGNVDLVAGVVQAFTIKHELIINPLILFDEFDNFKAGILPDRLLDENSLRYVFSIESSPILNNPNDNILVESDELDRGNVGGNDENFNGGAPNYSFNTLQYKKLSGELQTGLELTATETKLNFIVDSIGLKFKDFNTKMILKFHLAPSDESQYRDNTTATGKLMEDNFIYDEVQSTLGDVSGVPRQLGTDLQVIKSMTATRLSSSKIKVTANIQLSTDIVTRISALGIKQFALRLSVADHTLLRKDSDKVTLLIDADSFFVETSDLTMISISNTFMEHPFTVIGTEDKGSITARTEDDIVGISSFILDKNGRETDDIILTSATAQIIALKGSSVDVLDEFTTSLNDLDVINDPTFGGIPFVNITDGRGFKTPADALRQNVRLKRRTDLDAGGKFFYEFRFPFIFRWENWEKRDNADDDFFDDSKQNNGLNEQWARIDSTTGWDIYLRIIITALKNGDPQTYTKISQIFTEDYLLGSEWNAENQKSFIQSSGDEIGSGSNHGISLFEDNRIQANKTFIGSVAPALPDLVAVMKINVFEKGNFKEQFTLSSLHPAHPNTLWKGISPDTKVVITNPSGSIFRAEALLDFTKLPEEPTFKITTRYYDLRLIEGAKLLEDGTTKLTESGGVKVIE